MPQGSVLGPILFILFTADMWSIVENNFIAYADDASLFASIPSPADRISVSAALNSDLARIVEWCRVWGMKLNAKKTQVIRFSRSRTPDPAWPDLVIDGQVLNLSDTMKILGVILDSKLIFKEHIDSMVSALSRQVGLLRKSLRTFNSTVIAKKCFYSFLLPSFEYCSPVWGSAADTHLKLLERIVRQVRILIPDLTIDLEHRRKVAAQCMFYKIYNNLRHPVRSLLPDPYVGNRNTRHNETFNRLALRPSRYKTEQFKRSFIPSCLRIWNSLPDSVVDIPKIQNFKVKVHSLLRG